MMLIDLYDDASIDSLVGYIERCGGNVGGQAERASLWGALTRISHAWLRPRRGLTKRESMKIGARVRKAIRNGEKLLDNLGTTKASARAELVLRDIGDVEGRLSLDLLRMNSNLRELVMIYIWELRDIERDLCREFHRRDGSISSFAVHIRNGANKIYVTNDVSLPRQDRFQEWLEGVAWIWETSDLKADMGKDFSQFVSKCVPVAERCAELGLERPRPISERTVIDWLAKVRHPRKIHGHKL